MILIDLQIFSSYGTIPYDTIWNSDPLKGLRYASLLGRQIEAAKDVPLQRRYLPTSE